MDTITDVPSLRLFGDLYGTGCTSISLSDSAMIFVQNTTQHRDFGALVYDRTLYMIYCISLNPPTLGMVIYKDLDILIFTLKYCQDHCWFQCWHLKLTDLTDWDKVIWFNDPVLVFGFAIWTLKSSKNPELSSHPSFTDINHGPMSGSRPFMGPSWLYNLISHLISSTTKFMTPKWPRRKTT